VATVVTAVVPLVASGDSASASQKGDNHKVTLCHRTNSEHNPYVVITIDKAGVFKHGHDGHDEGGVYQPGDKANGIRWGDIIPAFDYYASPKDQAAGTVSHYPGLNNTADGLQVLANGCQVPNTPPTTTTPPPQTTSPSGSLTVVCSSTGGTVSIGTLSSGSASGGHFELVVNGTAQTVQSGQSGIAVPAQASLVLRYVASDSTTTTLDTETAPAACSSSSTTTPPPPPGETRGLTVAKSVTPTGPASIGDTLTYALAVTTTGNAAQTNVTVSDYLPGYRPGSTSGSTTYVTGSATCSGGGTCMTSYDAATHQVTWGLGTLPAGTTRTVSFRVTIDRPAGDSIPAFDVANTGVVGSTQVPPVTSNRVVTPVAAVEAVKTGTSAGSGSHSSSGSHESGTSVKGTKTGNLPHTGAARTGWLVGTGTLLLLMGIALVAKPELVLRRAT
jgi:uncharacterized repeat protein (TIGR01451 family)